MAISLLGHGATFSGQIYFWRNYFFTFLHKNYFDTTVTFLKQLLLQSFYFLRSFLLENSHHFTAVIFPRIAIFFRARLLPSSHFLRIGSSLGQAVFQTLTFLMDKLFRIKTFQKRYFFEPGTSVQHRLFQKSYFLEKVNFSEKQYFTLSIFPVQLPF